MKSDTSHFSPPACLDPCSAECCTAGEERRKSDAGHRRERPAQSFPSVLPQSDKDSGFYLPRLSVRGPSFLFNTSAVPRGRGAVCSTHRLIPAPWPPSAPSLETAPPLAAWGGPGVHPGRQPQAELEFGSPSQVCTGGRFLRLHIFNMFLWLCLFSMFALE